MPHADINELKDRIDLWTLGVTLVDRQKRLRCLTDSGVERTVGALATKMRDDLSIEELARLHVVPIARGGLFVAGQLSYLLGWTREQFEDDGISPICVVDDCSLTGKRFRQTLKKNRGREVWFCHLASAEPLRDAILKEESSVKGCISAVNLELWDQNDLAGFSDIGRYLNRSVEHIAFPWTEPGFPVNLNGKIVDGWRLLPPHQVLGNWAMLKLPAHADAIIPNIQLANGVVWRVLFDGGVRLYKAGDDGMVDLKNLAADVWRGCVGYRNRDVAVEWLMKTRNDFDRKAVESMVDILLARGMLVQI